MDLETLGLLIDYHYWSWHRQLDVVAGLSSEQYSRELVSSFPSLRATLAHACNAEAVWLGRILGEPFAGVTPEDVPDVAALRGRWADLEARVRRLVQGLDDAALQQTVVARTSQGKEMRNPLWQVLQHLCNHGSYHRGQVTTLLRQVGATPVATDLIFYYRQLSGQV